MEYDVVIVGAGPSGLSAAIRLKKKNPSCEICVVEKGSEVGAHILSGAVFDSRALEELIPEWKDLDSPIKTSVKGDEFYFLTSNKKGFRLPNIFIPGPMHNKGNYIVSMGNVCRWLSEYAEGIGIDIFCGFSASETLFDENGDIKGIATGDMGISQDGEQKSSYQPGMELHAKYTIFAEGCRGHLGKQIIKHFNLDADVDPQHYGIGIKEIWQIPEDQHKEGLVVHSLGWPLEESKCGGGAFLYHAENNQVYLGLIADLNYQNPHMSPFDEFQRWKHHPQIIKFLRGGTRISYGARALAKGGLNSLPEMAFPGGFIIGCDAGTMNSVKIKGNHTAMKSGILVADYINEKLTSSNPEELGSFLSQLKKSWLYDELRKARNFSGWSHKFPLLIGSAFIFIEHTIFRGRLPFTLHDKTPDHKAILPASECKKIEYLKPDNVISFDKASSVFLSNTNHEENQPCHLTLINPSLPIEFTLDEYDEPAQRYCPAGVYEIVSDDKGTKRFQINAQNCVHCKTCDIKEPSQNINWVAPEGAGGPNYPNM